MVKGKMVQLLSVPFLGHVSWDAWECKKYVYSDVDAAMLGRPQRDRDKERCPGNPSVPAPNFSLPRR